MWILCKSLRLVLVILSAFWSAPMMAQNFTDVANSAGVDDTSYSHGLAWGDYDNDGDVDLYSVNYPAPNRLYRNNGNGTFTDLGSTAGVNDTGNGLGSAWGDYDNDGDLDLYHTRNNAPNIFYHNNGNGTFTNIASNANINMDINDNSNMPVWGDYDNDGDLDLYLSINGNLANMLFRNDGVSGFSEIAGDVDVNLDISIATGSVGWGDYNDDGYLDLYVSNSTGSSANWLFRNNGNSTFTDVAVSAGVNHASLSGAGVAWGDFDNDTDLDLFLSTNQGTKVLYENNGNGTFANITGAAGVGDTGQGIGGAWADYDNDGDLDLYLDKNNGTNRLYQNNGNSTFTDVAVATGTADNGSGPGMAWADYDNDGDLDFYLTKATTNSLYRNNGNSNNWFKLDLTGLGGDKGGIGTKVIVVAGATRQRRDVESGTGYLSQPSLSVEFGLGSFTTIDSLIIEPPAGGAQILTNISTNQQLVFTDPGGPITFTEVGVAAGIGGSPYSTGSAWGDYDGDGDIDLYVVKGTIANVLYNNNGNGTFTNVAGSAGVDDSGIGTDATWGDYDNDGDLDLYTTNQENSDNHLYRNNDNGTFSDVTSTTNTNKSALSVITTSVAWGDYDNDGDLDLHVGGSSSFLFHNNGDNTFTNLATSSGANANTYSATWGDYDNDQDLDLYLNRSTGFGGTNILYRNNGDGTFNDVAGVAGVNDATDGRGAAWQDYDNDGDLDLYVASFNAVNLLYRNNNNGTFTNVANVAGVEGIGPGTGHTADWADFDNDGDVDLFHSHAGGADQLYRNNNDGTFTDVATTVGLADTDTSFGPSWGDYDQDGDVDLFLPRTSPASDLLYTNSGNSNRWLQIETVGTVSNKLGIGARIIVVANGVRQRRDIDGGSGLYSQPSLIAEFGLGGSTSVDSLIVYWPSGIVWDTTNVALDQALTVTEPISVVFTDVASAAGVDDSGQYFGVAWGDYDGDGNIDLYISRVNSTDRFYRNNGNNTFTNVTSPTGVSNSGDGRGVAWADFDNDGDLDLYISNGTNSPTNRLYKNNGNGTFNNIASSAGVNDNGDGRGVGWADYDRDGDVDLYLANHAGINRLYRNDGNDIFSDVAIAAGVNDNGDGRGIAWQDIDGDGDLDLHVVNVGVANRLYKNNGNNTFTDIAVVAGIDDPTGSGQGTDWGDFNNDGRPDLYVTKFNENNRLYRNEGNNTFTNISAASGVDDATGSFGVSWADYDQDGDLDLHISKADTNKLYENNGNGQFVDQSALTGVGDTDNGRGVAWADYDNDGDLDFYLANLSGTNKLFQNQGTGNQWLSATLIGTFSNQSAIGARVTAVTGIDRRIIEIDGGSGYYSQKSLAADFGFGGITNIDSLIVQWPSGIVWDTTNVAANQFLTITEFGSPQGLTLTIPDTVAQYGSIIDVPVRITDTSNLGIVASEISVTYRNDIVLSAVTSLISSAGTVTTNSLVYQGWSVEENTFIGSSVDTMSIAMSTAQDTLSGQGDLIYLTLQLADIRHPDSTDLAFVNVLFNDGTPISTNIDGSVKFVGSNGVINASPDSIKPGDTMSITVTDADLDLDVGSPDQVSATALGKGYGDSQYVTLTETGNNTGIFSGTVTTQFSLVAGSSNDGVITTIAGDSICVSYVDSLSAFGTTIIRQDTVDVVGGVDGVVSVSYVVQAFDGRNGVRDTVRVQISDADLDLDVGVAEQVSSTVTNAISGESEGVILTETGVNTGVFQARVPTIAGASGTHNDGVLSLASWDTLSVSYTDSLSSQGGLSTVNDITRVVNLFGDVQSNDQIQAFDAARLLAISVGLVSSNTQTTLVGDVDGGGAIQAFDASLVLQYVVRLIDRFPVQTDFTADPKNHPFEKPVLSNVIALGDLEAQGDGTYLVPVQLSEREGVLSGTLTFGADAGVEIMDVMLANDYGSFMVAHNSTDEGVKVAFAGSQSDLNGSGDVLMLRVGGVEGSPIRLSLDQVVLNGQSLTPSVNIEALETVESSVSEFVTELHQNLPNPFNPETTIRYGLAESGQVRVVIYSVTGQRVRTLVSAFQGAGAYQVTWDGLDALGHQVGSGVYLMRMTTDGFVQTRKMLFMK